MEILLVLLAGIVLGLFVIPRRFEKINGLLNQVLIVATLFAMGVSLGSEPSFLDNLKTAGILAAAFAVATSVLSCVPVYFIAKKLFASKPKKPGTKLEPDVSLKP